MHKKTGFVDSAGRIIKKAGSVFFVQKRSPSGEMVKAYGNKAHKREDGRNIANPKTVPPAIRRALQK
jgi:hypothetical protein